MQFIKKLFTPKYRIMQFEDKYGCYFLEKRTFFMWSYVSDSMSITLEEVKIKRDKVIKSGLINTIIQIKE